VCVDCVNFWKRVRISSVSAVSAIKQLNCGYAQLTIIVCLSNVSNVCPIINLTLSRCPIDVEFPIGLSDIYNSKQQSNKLGYAMFLMSRGDEMHGSDK